MAKVSSALRDRLLGQKKAMSGGGRMIDNKSLSRLKFRILPVIGEEPPGKPYMQYYCKSLNLPAKDDGSEDKRKGTASPLNWDLRDPLHDFFEDLKRTGTKEDRDAAYNYVNLSTEYWVGGIDRSDEGTAAAPNVRILQSKRGIYDSILTWMVDDDIGEDITDPKTGRDIFIKKEGKGLDTEWTSDKLDRSPISEDPAYQKAVIAIARTFDPAEFFYMFDPAIMEALYQGLTGEPIPSDYTEEWDEFFANRGKKGDAKAAKADKPARTAKPSTRVEEPEDDDDADGAEAEAGSDEHDDVPADPGEVNVGDRVKFEGDEGVEAYGTVIGIDDEEDYEGNLLIQGDDDDESDPPWSIPVAQVELVEAEAEEEQEPEPEPEPDPPAKSRRKAPAKAAAAAKPATKAAAKPAAKAETKAGPRKPAGKASSTIKDRLRR